MLCPAFRKPCRSNALRGGQLRFPGRAYRITHLLEQAGLPVDKVASVTVKGVTGYSRTLSPDEVANLDFMIALKVGGAPLTVDHGYPARLVAPTRQGLDWVKYVDEITATSN